MMSSAQIEAWKKAEDALAEHLRKCELCVFPSKRHLCRLHKTLEVAAFAAFKAGHPE